jgi:hypothetical protein
MVVYLDKAQGLGFRHSSLYSLLGRFVMKVNARVSRNKHAPPSVLFEKIKYEAKLWALAGAKRMNNSILED